MRSISIDGDIGSEITTAGIKAQLPRDGSPISVKIHSEGGSIFEAFAIHDCLKAYPGPKKAVVESMAFSAASLILCAFSDVEITENGYTMLHSPFMDGRTEATPADKQLLSQLRERMIGIYAARTGKPQSVISRLIDQESFFDAEASISLGLVDRIAKATTSIAARLPARVVAKLRGTATGTAKARWQAAVRVASIGTNSFAGAVNAVDKSHPGLRAEMLNEANRR